MRMVKLMTLTNYEEDQPPIPCDGCKKTSAWFTRPITNHYWSRSDYNGFFTGVYCDNCYDDPEKYPYRKDNYNQDAIENGENIWGEE